MGYLHDIYGVERKGKIARIIKLIVLKYDSVLNTISCSMISVRMANGIGPCQNLMVAIDYYEFDRDDTLTIKTRK